MIKLLFLFLFSITVEARQIRVVVLDTGFNLTKINQIKLCERGHKDFTRTSLNDTYGHGTHVSGLIHRHAKDADYCQLIFKFWTSNQSIDHIQTTILAMEHAIKDKVDIINYSGGGDTYDFKEAATVKAVLDNGIVLVVAAGNNNQNLDRNCHFFPACYDKRIIVVGNLKANGKRNPSSNYGKVVDVWVNGTDQESLGEVKTGTSMSCAIVSGRLVKIMSDKLK